MIHHNGIDWTQEHPHEGYSNCTAKQRRNKPYDKFQSDKRDKILNMSGTKWWSLRDSKSGIDVYNAIFSNLSEIE